VPNPSSKVYINPRTRSSSEEDLKRQNPIRVKKRKLLLVPDHGNWEKHQPRSWRCGEPCPYAGRNGGGGVWDQQRRREVERYWQNDAFERSGG